MLIKQKERTGIQKTQTKDSLDVVAKTMLWKGSWLENGLSNILDELVICNTKG